MFNNFVLCPVIPTSTSELPLSQPDVPEESVGNVEETAESTELEAFEESEEESEEDSDHDDEQNSHKVRPARSSKKSLNLLGIPNFKVQFRQYLFQGLKFILKCSLFSGETFPVISFAVPIVKTIF